ncbi:ABC transporter substrate-binding protein [Kutzneria sp. NPDC052558]|uniref:ABC transporter substrate-binding protein n=1 Tax=Kutzneria sp. NPDC052558 TaxID=3364121 RepID=UPI0037C5F280
MKRRNFLLGAAAAGLLAACGRPTAAETSGGAWTFTDDRGRKVDLDHRPARIVAQSGAAAALWDLGVHAVGVFGPQKRKDGSNDPQVGAVDLAAVQSVGTTYGEFNVEKLAALRPDLLVSGIYVPPALWYITDDVKDRVDALVKTVGISLHEKTAVDVIERYVQLGAALGADPAAVSAAKAAFDAAAADLAAAAKAKPTLRIIAVSDSAQNFDVAVPAKYADLSYYVKLGVPVTGPAKGVNSAYFEVMSWEQAAKYPADLILYDARTQALPLDQLLTHPTFAGLPAVKAGQIAPWHAETPFSYQRYTPVIKELTAAVAKAEPLG